jgi:hypothetical protein
MQKLLFKSNLLRKNLCILSNVLLFFPYLQSNQNQLFIMKKLFFAFTALTLLLTGCSSDDSDSNSEGTNILIDNVAFNASGAVYPFFNANTVYQEDSQSKVRLFQLASFSGNTNSTEQLSVSISYPVAQTSINGTYPVDSFEDTSADGGYSIGDEAYFFEGGTVTVTDLGNNKYKLQFNNVIAVEFDEVLPNKTITGSYEGIFTSMQ